MSRRVHGHGDSRGGHRRFWGIQQKARHKDRYWWKWSVKAKLWNFACCRSVYINSSVTPQQCDCPSVVLIHLNLTSTEADSFCPRCKCDYQTRNLSIIKVTATSFCFSWSQQLHFAVKGCQSIHVRAFHLLAGDLQMSCDRFGTIIRFDERITRFCCCLANSVLATPAMASSPLLLLQIELNRNITELWLSCNPE